MEFPLVNGYTTFVNSFIHAQKKKGIISTFQNAFKEAFPFWKILNERERKRYKKEARKMAEEELVPSGFYTEDGIDLALQDSALSVETFVHMMDLFNNNNDSDILHKDFHILHSNFFCKDDDNNYVVAEFALTSFNISDGIGETLHKLIDPKILPVNGRITAEVISNLTHRIKLPPFMLEDNGYSGVFDNIMQIIQKQETLNMQSPIFVDRDNLEATRSFIQQAYHRRESGSHYTYPDIHLYPIDLLFFYLKNHFVDLSVVSVNEEEWFEQICDAYEELKMLHHIKIEPTCYYHFGMTGHEQFCSFNITVRRIFTIVKHIRNVLGLTNIPGKHCEVRHQPSYQNFSNQQV